MCVVARLLRLRRKSDPKFDETQARILGQAAALNFANVKVGELPFDMHNHVHQFVGGAEQAPVVALGEAVLQGCSAFRFLLERWRGHLHIDTNNRRLTIETLP
jgi:hypothetical protein